MATDKPSLRERAHARITPTRVGWLDGALVGQIGVGEDEGHGPGLADLIDQHELVGIGEVTGDATDDDAKLVGDVAAWVEVEDDVGAVERGDADRNLEPTVGLVGAEDDGLRVELCADFVGDWVTAQTNEASHGHERSVGIFPVYCLWSTNSTAASARH